MKYLHTFGTDRHNRQADVTLLFQYINNLPYSDRCFNTDRQIEM